MKGLLQSKRFRKNLKKWLCMYVGTLLILTTVITYSKYISSLGGSDESRVTKFDVKLNKVGENLKCSGTEDESIECTTDNYRPTQEITYDFTIETDVEVNTELYTFIYVLNDFDIIELRDMTTNEVIYPNNSTDSQYPSIGTIEETIDGNTVTKKLLKTKMFICASKNQAKTYRITVKYSKYDKDTEAKIQLPTSEIVKIGYSAQQTKEGDSLCITE